MTVIDQPRYELRLYEGVRTRRIFAFLIDFAVVCVLWTIACVAIFFLGVITLGLAWMLYGAVFPIVAILYSGMSIAGRQSTVGMRAMGLRFRTETGEPPSFLQGAIHVILFYVTTVFLTPFILLVSLFNSRKRMLHDMLIGAVIENA